MLLNLFIKSFIRIIQKKKKKTIRGNSYLSKHTKHKKSNLILRLIEFVELIDFSFKFASFYVNKYSLGA